jgi:fatty-acyl-CoA synthase
MAQLPLTTSHWPADTSLPVRETTVGGVLRAAAEQAPRRIALVDGGPDPAGRREWRYAELLAGAERIARGLAARYEPGEHLAVWAGNCPEWVLLEYAAGLAGLVLVTVNPAYQAAELLHVLRHSKARGLFLAASHQGRALPAVLAAVRDQLPELREVVLLSDLDQGGQPEDLRPLPAVNPHQPAQILYTSGTTSRPKAAVLTHHGLTNNARLAAAAAGLRAGETAINSMPLFHVAGSGLLTLGVAQSLATQVLMPYFCPVLELELIETYRAALIGGVPTMLSALIGHRGAAHRDLSSLRVGIGGGAPFSAGLVRAAEAAFGIPFLISFGQTEASCSVTSARRSDSAADRRQTVGRPLPQTEVKIVDPRTGQTVPPGTTGEICARGYGVMSGYLADEAATSAAIDSDGWLHSGDLGAMDERGYCRILGRIKELIIQGGENIYPSEIEDVLLRHPGVAEVAVVGVPDRFWGEVVGAVIRTATAEPPAVAELARLCGGQLADYKTPSHWLFTDTFPLTASGKIRKDALRARLAAAV